MECSIIECTDSILHETLVNVVNEQQETASLSIPVIHTETRERGSRCVKLSEIVETTEP